MNNLCPIHKTPFVKGTYGLYCNKPLTKSADGKEVLEWCKEKPGKERPELVSETVKDSETWLNKEQPKQQSTESEEKVQGMVRHGLLVARTELVGLVPLTREEYNALVQLTDVIITGKYIDGAIEDVDQEELDKVFQNG